MVASPHATATLAGVDVLRRGGNAVDAAIAVNAMLAVVYPASCGVGGDAFWMVYEPTTGETTCYNGSGRAPEALSAAHLRERGDRTMPVRGAYAVTVPGAVRSWEDVGRLHGTRGLDELLAPAAAYARDGFAISDVVAQYIALNVDALRGQREATRIFLGSGVPTAGIILRNPDLADTIDAIRTGGADAFYHGHTGERIVATLGALGSPMSMSDLAAHHTQTVAPWRLPWHGGEVVSHPPNSHGSTAQMVLGALANDRDPGEAAWSHLAIEAFKHAFKMRDTQFGDPDFNPVARDEALGEDVLAALRERIDPQRVTASFTRPGDADTIAIVVVDADGRAVTLIESLYMNFGSGLVAEGTGVVLHNRGAYFNLVAGHPNELQGGHRPVHTLSPAMYLREGKPHFVFGTMGGDGQPQIHVQLLHNVFERGLDVQQALDAPRWIAGRPHIPGRDDVMTDTVVVESRMAPDVIDGLRARGHAVESLGAYENAMGHAHGILIDREAGTLAGGSDPRADSLALGY